MPSAQRRIDAGVAERLLNEPYRFEFFQAVRVLEHLLPQNGVRKQDVLPKQLRFRNTLNMGFAASQIEQLRAFAKSEDSTQIPEQVDVVEMTPAFMGMLGAQGVLPIGYTEKFGSRELYQRDATARAFLDIFTNRAVALFYSAWKKYRLDLQHELSDDAPGLRLLLSLAGLGSDKARSDLHSGKGQLHDNSLAYHAGALTQRPVSATTLARVLQEHFGVVVRVEQFVGAWYDLPEAQCMKLGQGKMQLGVNAIAGKRVWQRDLRIRLWIGPLDKPTFEQFLPGAAAAEALKKWLLLLTGDALEYQIKLILKQSEVRPGSLSGGKGVRLGFDSYLCTRASHSDRSGTSYLINSIH